LGARSTAPIAADWHDGQISVVGVVTKRWELLARLVAAYEFVMRGLDPRIHRTSKRFMRSVMDCRVKPGNDISY